MHVLFGDAGDHQALFGQNGDQPLLFQTPQCIPHGGAADVAHLGAELLLVQKLVGAVLAVQDLGLEVLVRLQLQAELCLCVLLFHKHTLLFFFVFFSKNVLKRPNRQRKPTAAGFFFMFSQLVSRLQSNHFIQYIISH